MQALFLSVGPIDVDENIPSLTQIVASLMQGTLNTYNHVDVLLTKMMLPCPDRRT